MKSKLNITIEENLLNKAKRFAEKNHISLSQLIERYLERIIRKGKKENIVELVEKLLKPKHKLPADLKKAYYESRK